MKKILSAEQLKKALKDPIIGAIMAQRQTYTSAVMDFYRSIGRKPEPAEPVRVAADGTMTVMQAFNKARDEKQVVMVESTPFAMLGWKSPESGETKGPYMITVWMACAVEIGENGRFKDMFPAGAEGYFVWMEEK